MATREAFGDYRRQLSGVDFGGLSEASVHQTLELMGGQVLPVLHRALTPAPTTV